MRKLFLNIGIIAIILVSAAWGQGLPDQLNFSQSNMGGFHLYGVSTFFTGSRYNFLSSAALSSSSLAGPSVPDVTRGQYGAGATLGWQHFQARSRLTMAARYSVTYNGASQAPYSRALDHSLSLNIGRSFGQKWSFSVSGTGQELSLNQSLFEQNLLGVISQSATSFDDLAAAMSVGQFTSPEGSALLTGGAGYSPILSVLLGSRVLSYSLNTDLSYRASARLQFQIGGFAMGGQRRTDYNNTGIVLDNYVVPKTVGATASASFTYSFSPRTDFGLGVSQTYATSRLQSASASSVTASFGRKMGKNWFLRAHGGTSLASITQQITGRPRRGQLIWGGSIGYRAGSNTFLASYDRSGYDSISAAVGTNTSYSGAWGWRRRGSGWGLQASYSRHETANTGFSSLSGWRGGGALSRALGRQLSLSMSGSYLRSSGTFIGNQSSVEVRAIRVSLSWTPRLFRGGSSAADDSNTLP